MNLSYNPPQCVTTLFEKHLQNLSLRHDVCKQEVLITGDFNTNLLDSKKVQSFVNSTFRCGMVPIINKPTRVMRYTATAIDHMFTNSIINTEIQSAIIQANISDHFPKRNICDQSIKKFKQKLCGVTWDDIKIFDNVSHYYNRFFQIFLSLYNEYFPKIKIKLKLQKHFRPWITLTLQSRA